MLQLSCSQGATLQALRTITFVYSSREDRVRAAINAGAADAWSCWITRRLALALLGKANEFLVNTSSLMQRAAPEHRTDLASFEREAAMAQTAKAMSQTPQDILTPPPTASAAELAQAVTITKRGERYQVDIRGEAGGGVSGLLTRAELQRIMQMLQEVAVKAAWPSAAAAAQPALASEPAPAPSSRH